MDQRPTKKQRELLNFIDGFIKGNGYGPSYREIMRALDYKSVSTVATHVNGLIARGWLLKKDNTELFGKQVSSGLTGLHKTLSNTPWPEPTKRQSYFLKERESFQTILFGKQNSNMEQKPTYTKMEYIFAAKGGDIDGDIK